MAASGDTADFPDLGPLPVAHSAGGVKGQLPPIVEGKYYPRRTLRYVELCLGKHGGLTTTSGDAADSPDLGRPPVAHFDAGDPVKFNANQHERSEVTPGREDSGGPGLLAR
ncbi:MAG: hypothetical protein Q9169_006727 [Polycauliona sp. 2 TL-2023]